jgi:hypothetical protein
VCVCVCACVCVCVYVSVCMFVRVRAQEGDLYSSPELINCIVAGCVPCAYKMVVQPSLPGVGDAARFRANKRPGVCVCVCVCVCVYVCVLGCFGR